MDNINKCIGIRPFLIIFWIKANVLTIFTCNKTKIIRGCFVRYFQFKVNIKIVINKYE